MELKRNQSHTVTFKLKDLIGSDYTGTVLTNLAMVSLLSNNAGSPVAWSISDTLSYHGDLYWEITITAAESNTSYLFGSLLFTADEILPKQINIEWSYGNQGTEEEGEGDIRLTYVATDGYADFSMFNRDLERDDGLETSVLISLFTNKRADDTDALPDPDGDRQGWWADAVSEDVIGSKLWLLGRAKLGTTEVIPLGEQYTRECLQWMIDDGVADDIIVEVIRTGTYSIRITIQIIRPNVEDNDNFTYFYNWENQLARTA